MFQSFFRSWKLVKESWRVLRSDRSLVLFPFISLLFILFSVGIFALILQLAGVLPLLFLSQGHDLAIFSNHFFQILFLILCFVVCSIVIFTDTGLIYVAIKNLHGERVTVTDGFTFALQRMHQILLYSVISAVAGFAIGDIENSNNPLLKILGYSLSFAWNISTFLVIPIFIVENINPVKAIERSIQLLKKTWGDQLVATLTMDTFFNLITISSLLLIGLPTFILFMIMESFLPLFFGVLLITIIGVTSALFNTTLSGVFKAALYMYATTGEVVQSFDTDIIKQAFLPKGGAQSTLV